MAELILGIAGTTFGVISGVYSIYLHRRQINVEQERHDQQMELETEHNFKDNFEIYKNHMIKLNHIFKLYEHIYCSKNKLENAYNLKDKINLIFDTVSHITRKNHLNNNNKYTNIHEIIKIYYKSLEEIITEFKDINNKYIKEDVEKELIKQFNNTEKKNYNNINNELKKINNQKIFKHRLISEKYINKKLKKYIKNNKDDEYKKFMGKYNLYVMLNFYKNNTSNIYTECFVINQEETERFFNYIFKYYNSYETRREFNNKILKLNAHRVFDKKYSFEDIYNELIRTMKKMINLNNLEERDYKYNVFLNPRKYLTIYNNISYPEFNDNIQLNDEESYPELSNITIAEIEENNIIDDTINFDENDISIFDE
jgi:hypothetical protein